MNTLGLLSSLLPCGLIVVVFAVLPAVVDLRTRRGYALCILSSLLLAGAILVIGTSIIQDQTQTQPVGVVHHSMPNLLLVFYFIFAVYATAATLIAAAIVAGGSHDWFWIPAFLLSALVPVMLVVPPHPGLDMNTEFVVQNVGFVGMLVAPEATILAYSITRLVRPIAPATVSQVASRS